MLQSRIQTPDGASTGSRARAASPAPEPFFGALRAVLVEDGGDLSFEGAIRRSEAAAVWTWLSRDVAPDLIDPNAPADDPRTLPALEALTSVLLSRARAHIAAATSDPEADRRALQEQAMRMEAVAVAGIKLASGEAPGPVDVNNHKIQTWLEDRYAASAGKEDYQKLRASFQDKNAGAAARVMESEMVERLARRFKTRDTGPISAFHAELLERLTRQTKIADESLLKLAQARGQVMRDALVKLGLDASRVSVSEPVKQTAKEKLVGSKLNLGADAKPKAEVVPVATPAAASP